MSPTPAPCLDWHLAELEDGPLAWFRDWPDPAVPPVAAGVYTVWMEDILLYAGMAGRGLTQERAAHTVALGGKPTGLVTRLASHASGRRSGDQFCVYVCDRFVVPDLTADDLAELRHGARLLDGRTRAFVRDRLAYRFALTPDGSSAHAVEAAVRRGAWAAGPPLINPL